MPFVRRRGRLVRRPGRRDGRPGARLAELDALRFVAAFAVVLFHFVNPLKAAWDGKATALFPDLAVVSRFGFLGVHLFFVISGFVILMSAWGRSVGEFGVSRVARLMPAYWFSVVLFTVLSWLRVPGGGTPRPPWEVITNTTFFAEAVGLDYSDGVYWTLWVEFRFYVLMALLVAIGITYRRCLYFMGGWTVVSVLTAQADDATLKAIFMPEYSPFFIGGMALYLIYRFGPTLIAWGMVLVSVALGASWAVEVMPRWARHGMHYAPHVVTGGVVVIFGVLSLVALRRLSWIRWSGLTALGALTYPLYLVHNRIGSLVIDALHPGWDPQVVLSLAIVAAVSAAYLIYRLVERPLGRRLRAALGRSLERTRGIEGPAPERVAPSASAPADLVPAARERGGPAAPQR